jgi:hypothetical protein
VDKLTREQRNIAKAKENDRETNWGTIRFIMPHEFAGGLYMSVANIDHTNVAVRVKATLDRYFDGASAQAANIGKTDKFPLLEANTIQIIMQRKSTWTEVLNTAKPFSITYTRASYAEIAKFTAENGGAVVWIIVGVVALLACIVGGVVWKCFHKKNPDKTADDAFYAVEDCYARV